MQDTRAGGGRPGNVSWGLGGLGASALRGIVVRPACWRHARIVAGHRSGRGMVYQRALGFPYVGAGLRAVPPQGPGVSGCSQYFGTVAASARNAAVLGRYLSGASPGAVRHGIGRRAWPQGLQAWFRRAEKRGIRHGANGWSRHMRPEGYGVGAGVRLKFLWGGMMPARSDYVSVLAAAGIASMGLASGFGAEYARAGITGLVLGLGVWAFMLAAGRPPSGGRAGAGPRARSGGPRVRARHGGHDIDNAVRRLPGPGAGHLRGGCGAQNSLRGGRPGAGPGLRAADVRKRQICPRHMQPERAGAHMVRPRFPAGGSCGPLGRCMVYVARRIHAIARMGPRVRAYAHDPHADIAAPNMRGSPRSRSFRMKADRGMSDGAARPAARPRGGHAGRRPNRRLPRAVATCGGTAFGTARYPHVQQKAPETPYGCCASVTRGSRSAGRE